MASYLASSESDDEPWFHWSKVPTLKSPQDWKAWERACIIALDIEGLLPHLDEGPPQQAANETSDAFASRQQQWQNGEVLATQFLLKTVSSSIGAGVHAFDTFKSQWHSLELLYQPPYLQNGMLAYDRFLDLQYRGKDLEKYGDKYQEILQDCKKAGVEIPKNIAVYEFIMRIQQHYPDLADIFRHQCIDEDEKTIPEVRTLISTLLLATQSERARDNMDKRGHGRRGGQKKRSTYKA